MLIDEIDALAAGIYDEIKNFTEPVDNILEWHERFYWSRHATYTKFGNLPKSGISYQTSRIPTILIISWFISNRNCVFVTLLPKSIELAHHHYNATVRGDDYTELTQINYNDPKALEYVIWLTKNAFYFTGADKPLGCPIFIRKR